MTISRSLATLLRDCRNNYHYPGAYVAVTEVAPFDVAVGTLMARFNPGGRASNTPLSLDAYHHSLVARSGSPDLEHLGAASIIYWGFITFSDGLARGRAGDIPQKKHPRLFMRPSHPPCAIFLESSMAGRLAALRGLPNWANFPLLLNSWHTCRQKMPQYMTTESIVSSLKMV